MALQYLDRLPGSSPIPTDMEPPFFAIALSSALGLLSYMAVGPASASKVFNWLSSMSAVSGMFNWFGICLTGIRFRAGLKAQGIDPKSLPWHSKLQPYAAYYGMVWVILIILFANWEVFLKGHWDHSLFITTYFPVPVFIGLFFGYKWWYNTQWIGVLDMDFASGTESSFKEEYRRTY